MTLFENNPKESFGNIKIFKLFWSEWDCLSPNWWQNIPGPGEMRDAKTAHYPKHNAAAGARHQ